MRHLSLSHLHKLGRLKIQTIFVWLSPRHYIALFLVLSLVAIQYQDIWTCLLSVHSIKQTSRKRVTISAPWKCWYCYTSFFNSTKQTNEPKKNQTKNTRKEANKQKTTMKQRKKKKEKKDTTVAAAVDTWKTKVARCIHDAHQEGTALFK